MRTEIFDPSNFQVCLRIHKKEDKLTLYLLDRRLPTRTEVEQEETCTYGITPMYYADDCCFTSAAYLARIVRETLVDTFHNYIDECHIYTAYTILPCCEAQEYLRKHRIHMHSGVVPADWHQCHTKTLHRQYRCAERAIECLMHDLQTQDFCPDMLTGNYSVPAEYISDLESTEPSPDDTIDTVWMRLRQLSDPYSLPCMCELNQMIGMSAFKTYIHQLICSTQIRRMRGLMGLRSEQRFPMHFVFTGNPGTGKTTAAKALGEALHEAGLISRGKVIYRDRSTLVGAHVGESENAIRELFEHEAQGNVVVIDEAYSLTSDQWKGDFGHRIVDSLMTYTADPEADYVVILCGYSKEMDQMLTSNPGLRSRFSLRFDFPDYTHQELMEITQQTLQEMDYHFSDKAEEAYSLILRKVLKDPNPNFGNARWVKAAIHQHIIMAQHRRLTRVLTQGSVQLTRELFSTIEVEDILKVAYKIRHLTTSLTATNTPPRRIGFAA